MELRVGQKENVEPLVYCSFTERGEKSNCDRFPNSDFSNGMNTGTSAMFGKIHNLKSHLK